ncbi:Leucine-rich repeat containing protein [Entamoeba marina]
MKLEKLFLTKVVNYLDSVETAILFFSINKKCAMISTMLKINPFYDRETIEKEIILFPNIETLRCTTYFLKDKKKLPTSIKYIHLFNTFNYESHFEKDIPKKFLSLVTSFKTYLTKLSILKQMDNLEFLKVICYENRKINGEIFKELGHNNNLKTVVVDTRECDNKFVIKPLLQFDPKNIKIVLICSELNEIISKKNVTVMCSQGSSEVTKMLTNEYIPVERTYFFKNVQAYASKKEYYYKYDISCFENIEHFNSMFEKMLPVNVVIDIGKKKGSKAVLPNQLHLNIVKTISHINTLVLVGGAGGKKKTIKGNSFNILTPENVKEITYEESVDIQTNYLSATKLTISNSGEGKTLDMSKMINLEECHIDCLFEKVIFPHCQLEKVIISCRGLKTVENLFTNELDIKNIPPLSNIFDASIYNSLSIPPMLNKIDLSGHTTLSCLKAKNTGCIQSLPLSLNKIEFNFLSHNFEDSYFNQFSTLVSKLTNLHSLTIPSNYTCATENLVSLKSLTCFNYYRITKAKKLSKANLSKLTNLVELSFDSDSFVPTLPNSLTKIQLRLDKYPNEFISLKHISNLQYLDIIGVKSPIELPSKLTHLHIDLDSNHPLNLTDIQIINLVYESKFLVDECQLKLPTTLETCRLFIRNPLNIALPSLKKLTNLKSLSFQFGYSQGKSKIHYGPWYLPSSITSIYNSNESNIVMTYENVENTQLSGELKKELSSKQKKKH